MLKISYLLIAITVSIFIFSSIENSQAQSGPILKWGSPNVMLEESENIVLTDSSQSGEGPIMVKAKAKHSSGSDTINVYLTEYKNTGNFIGQVKFTDGPNNGSLYEVHAEPGDQIIVKIPQTSIKDTGEVLPAESPNQIFGDMRFDTDYVDCDLDGFGGDRDGDGICADWETGEKLVINWQGTEVYSYTCDPACDDTIKDIFLEVDWMEGHRPTQLALDHIKESFTASGVKDTSGEPVGIRLHIQVDDGDSGNIPHNDETFFPGDPDDKGFDQIKGEWFGTPEERDVPGWNETGWNNKRQAFHYALFVHSQAQTTESGAAETFGNDIIVSLGYFPGNIGTVYDQEGTLMHELGHNLNLEHGGGDLINCKPNYLSVMSYSRQSNEFLNNRALDFSKQILGTMSGNPDELDENELLTGEGIGIYPPNAADKIIYNNTNNVVKKQIVGSSCVNWDPNVDCEDTQGIIDDTNTIQASDGHYLCYEPEKTILKGYDDWNTGIAYGFRGSGGYDNGSPGPSGEREEIRVPDHKCPPVKVAVPSHSAAAHKFRECAGTVGASEIKTLEKTGEFTYEDVKTIRIVLVDQLESIINNLPEESFEVSTKIIDKTQSYEKQSIRELSNKKQKYLNEFAPVFKTAKEKIRNDDLRGAINDISKIRKSFDERIIDLERDLVKGEANELVNSYVKVLSIKDPTIEKFLGPIRQIEQGVSYQDVQCNFGLSLMVNKALEDAICVRENTGIYLKSFEGWKDYNFVSIER